MWPLPLADHRGGAWLSQAPSLCFGQTEASRAKNIYIFEAGAPLFYYGLDKREPLLLEDLNQPLIGKGSTGLVIWPEF